MLALFAVNCSNQANKPQSSDKNTVSIAPENLQSIEISVYGMSCEGCERTIQTAIGELTGIQEVKASHLDSTVIVKFDKTEVTFDKMKTVITDKGYTVNDFKTVTQ
jgi:copper chaperone